MCDKYQDRNQIIVNTQVPPEPVCDLLYNLYLTIWLLTDIRNYHKALKNIEK